MQCPGFRNLGNVLFRDESERIIRKARALHEQGSTQYPGSCINHDAITQSSSSTRSASPTRRDESSTFAFQLPNSIPYTLSRPISDLGSHFFFANYACDGPPPYEGFDTWLTKTYFEDRPNDALRTAIEAVGMAGISNKFHAPHIASKSKEQYGRALAATKQALSDPIKSVADTTLMAVIVLGLFEVSLASWL